MKRVLNTAALLVGIVFTHIACDDGEKSSLIDTRASVQSPQAIPAIEPGGISPEPVTTGTLSGAALNPKHGEPGHRCDIAVGAPLNSAASPATQTVVSPQQPLAPAATQPLNLSNLQVSQGSGGGALNPKHGEPGHRCDIAVGAPLNSAASPATQTAVSPQQPMAPAAQALNLSNLSVSQGNGAVALNPKHGEPGHRCDLQVGAPLNSQPAAATNTQPLILPNTSTPVTNTSTASALPVPSLKLPMYNSASSGSGKLNPKHGEPGHRCDIAVGAPLK